MNEMITHHPNFLTDEQGKDFLEILSQNVSWKIFAPSPKSRKVAQWIPDDNNILVNEIIIYLIDLIKDKYKINSCKGVFLNLYDDGSDYCSYHKDVYGTDVYTISLGSTRDFLVKEDGKGNKAEKYTLKNGDLYYMSEKLHEKHKHSIPKRTRVTEPRISVVFFTK